MTTWYQVTRDVAADEPGNHSHLTIGSGEVYPEYAGPRWGCVDDDNEVALEAPSGSFFTLPWSAVERIRASIQGEALLNGRHEATDVDPCGNGPIPEVPF